MENAGSNQTFARFKPNGALLDIGYRPVDADIRIRLGTPPAGHEFVRVAGDILLIAVGTAMVIDAIEDLQR